MKINIKNLKVSDKINSPDALFKICKAALEFEDIIDQEKEHFWVFGLTTANRIKYFELVSLGILNASLVSPRETFRLAISEGVCSIIVAHNHPSGNLQPSREDINITNKLVQSGKILEIPVLDHLIIAENKYYSFSENNLI